MTQNIIYGLRDPRNDVYVYIGKSTIGTARALSHLTISHNEAVNKWVNSIRETGFQPCVDILEENILLENLQKRENYYIKQFSFSQQLFNKKLINQKVVSESISVEDAETIKYNIYLAPTALKKFRVSNKLSQEDVSKVLGLSRATVAKLESANFNSCSVENLIKTIDMIINFKNE